MAKKKLSTSIFVGIIVVVVLVVFLISMLQKQVSKDEAEDIAHEFIISELQPAHDPLINRLNLTSNNKWQVYVKLKSVSGTNVVTTIVCVDAVTGDVTGPYGIDKKC